MMAARSRMDTLEAELLRVREVELVRVLAQVYKETTVVRVDIVTIEKSLILNYEL